MSHKQAGRGKSAMKKAAIVASVISVFVFSIFYFGNKNRNSEIVQTNPAPVSTELLPQSVEENIAQKQKIAEEYGKLPLQFEPNLGQTDSQVKFMARGQGYALFLTGTGSRSVFGKKHEGQK